MKMGIGLRRPHIETARGPAMSCAEWHPARAHTSTASIAAIKFVHARALYDELLPDHATALPLGLEYTGGTALAGDQRWVEWQSSQVFGAGRWFGILPVARLPL